MKRLTERRDAQWVIPLRNDGRYKWALCEAGMSLDDSSEYLYGDHANHLTAYEDTGLEPEDIDALRKREQGLAEMLVNVSCGCAVPYTRLAELAQAEKDGRLVVLPIPVGARKVAYGLTDSDDGQQHIVTIECDYLEKLEIWDNPGHEVVIEADGWEIRESDIGKTIFRTREEAEAALKKREEANNAKD